MHYKCRRLHFGEEIGDIEIAHDIEISGSALGRSSSALQFVENICLLVVAPGMNSPVNICRKLGLSAPHPRRINVVIAMRFSFSA